MGNYFDSYLENRVLSADPVELIQMLYRAAIDNIVEARQALAAGDIERRGQKISRAMEIVAELALSLNLKVGKAISLQLAELYDYMQRRLMDGHIEQSEEPLSETQRLLETLEEAWLQCRPEANEEVAAAGV